jgi:tetratricopeptide (TPR) repeat protein
MNKSIEASDKVTAWVDKIILPTYPVYPPEPNPMFFEKRNIQGSAGNIYPVPFTDRLSSEKVNHEWEVILLENKYIQMTMLPALGGRIFAGLDKTNHYNFFYHHEVIKPALIGLYGPWISGGVEFNWPQHHRPSTFMPVEYVIEDDEDGSKTVWLSEHEPTNRMKGMVGICLYPDQSYVEMKVQLYNRTPYVQSFLWWANAAVHIHEDYQVFFPPDVHYAVFHTKQLVVPFPIATGPFNSGIDFGKGVDVSWYKNIDIASSFFAAESKYDFFGGYDHRRDAGVVHIANRHISPGKKFFTWANGSFGHQWQHNLADKDDPYLELMAGVYTDNQPDFSWLRPYETKIFSQIWYPIQKTGAVKNANRWAAVNLELKDNIAEISVISTQVLPNAEIRLDANTELLYKQKVDLEPGKPFKHMLELSPLILANQLKLSLCKSDGSEILHYQPEADWDETLPEPYQPPPSPTDTKTIEELFLIGLHLYQYRHPVIEPEPYWEEGLRRDPGDSRCTNAMGLSYLRRGLFEKALEYFRTAVRRITWRNLNPYDAEAYYNLGLTLRFLGKDDEAYDAFYRSIWEHTWQNAGYYALAELDNKHGRFADSLAHTTLSLQTNSLHTKAYNLKSAIWRHIGRQENLQAALNLCLQTIQLDPVDLWAQYELTLLYELLHNDAASSQKGKWAKLMQNDPQNYLDLSLDYAQAGLYTDAMSVLQSYVDVNSEIYPMILYAQGYFAHLSGDVEQTRNYYHLASLQPPDYCFPARLEEMLILRDVLSFYPTDARACYYLGNLLYDKKQKKEAVMLWEKSSQIDPTFSIPWRNLGLAAYNVEKNASKALTFYQRAFEANPKDPRVLSELDQIRSRLGISPEERLNELNHHLDIINLRDDLIIQRVALLLRTGQPDAALEILKNHHFHPWEGGEGQVSGRWNTAHVQLGRKALAEGAHARALEHFLASIQYPNNLGEVSFGEFQSGSNYHIGLVKEALGDVAGAKEAYNEILEDRINNWWGSNLYYVGLAQAKLGQIDESTQTFKQLLEMGMQEIEQPFVQNYFYPQNPSVTFLDDPEKSKKLRGHVKVGLAYTGLGQLTSAREAFETILDQDPANLEAWFLLQQIQ